MINPIPIILGAVFAGLDPHQVVGRHVDFEIDIPALGSLGGQVADRREQRGDLRLRGIGWDSLWWNGRDGGLRFAVAVAQA